MPRGPDAGWSVWRLRGLLTFGAAKEANHTHESAGEQRSTLRGCEDCEREVRRGCVCPKSGERDA